MWRILQEVEDAVWFAASNHLPEGALRRKRLVQSIERRTALYTTYREELATFAASGVPAEDVAARALFFGLADAAKVGIPLAELKGRGLFPNGTPLRVLDLGAGTGAMGLGLLSFLAENGDLVSVHVDAVDNDERALAIYRTAVEKLSDDGVSQGTVHPVKAHLGDYAISANSYDLVLMGSVLNELPKTLRLDLVSRAMAAVHKTGALIAVEPALQKTSRELHEVRDTLIEAGSFVFAPCTRRIVPCPALADERDWCHEDRPVFLPERTRQLSQATGLRDSNLKFSYLVMRHEDDPLVSTAQDAVALRVVSKAQRGKGQRTCFVCGPAGRHGLRLMRKNRGPKNRIFERSKRGDVLLLRAQGTTGTMQDIKKGEEVQRLSPAIHWAGDAANEEDS